MRAPKPTVPLVACPLCGKLPEYNQRGVDRGLHPPGLKVRYNCVRWGHTISPQWEYIPYLGVTPFDVRVLNVASNAWNNMLVALRNPVTPEKV